MISLPGIIARFNVRGYSVSCLWHASTFCTYHFFSDGVLIIIGVIGNNIMFHTEINHIFFTATLHAKVVLKL